MNVMPDWTKGHDQTVSCALPDPCCGLMAKSGITATLGGAGFD